MLATLQERLRHRENGRLASGAVMVFGGVCLAGLLLRNPAMLAYGPAGVVAGLIAIIFYLDARQMIADLSRRIVEIERGIKDLWPASG
jgi:uncharacterized membrane protein HdeD (DUF308 family)